MHHSQAFHCLSKSAVDPNRGTSLFACIACGIVILLALTGCASRTDSGSISQTTKPASIKVTYTDLSRQLAERFPVEKSVAGLLAFQFMNPRLDSDSGKTLEHLEGRRINITFEVETRFHLSAKIIKGRVSISASPQWSAEKKAVLMSALRTEAVHLDHLPEALTGGVVKPLGSAATELVSSENFLPIGENHFRADQTLLHPTRMIVERDGLLFFP